ncbi:NUDIX hydrolase [Neptunicoccus sediminis]|uniref:NUDIX hydrolase n=1 Tax=Neptunicoccus sediminis TaxID=1892596 RepID=UPI00084600A0|nr:NUDIX hydrolase [Neptunicoccus sediminis]
MRRFGEPKRNGVSYTQRAGAYGIIADGSDLMLTLQNAEFPEIQLPGGGIDPGETPLQALHREVYEETGFHITNPRRIGAYQRYTYMPEYRIWARKVCHIYTCTAALRIGPPTEPEHEVLWMSPREAIDMLSNSGDRAFVRRVCRV